MERYTSTELSVIKRQEEIAEGIFSMWVESGSARDALPGQFAMIYPNDDAHILGRPISICDIDRDLGSLRFVYQKKGFGTGRFANMRAGDRIRLLSPLGTGFPLKDDKPALLVGGGMGVAPLLALARRFRSKATLVLGYRDDPFLKESFEETGAKILLASESGRTGVKGNVITAIESKGLNVADYRIFSCGPRPMLKAVASLGKEKGAETYVSLEEKMACGLGVCLGCVTKATGSNDHYRVQKLCVCKDGPVFNAREVVI